MASAHAYDASAAHVVRMGHFRDGCDDDGHVMKLHDVAEALFFGYGVKLKRSAYFGCERYSGKLKSRWWKNVVDMEYPEIMHKHVVLEIFFKYSLGSIIQDKLCPKCSLVLT